MARHRSLSKNLPETQPSSSHLVADPAAKYKKLPKKSPGISIFLMLPLLFKILVFLGIFIYGLFQLYAGGLVTTWIPEKYSFQYFHQFLIGFDKARVVTPLQAPFAVNKTGKEVPSLFWGSYRPGVYFGLKTRSPRELLAGLMWMLPERLEPSSIGLRHWCEQGDNLDTFGWNQHDGRNFGIQKILDRGVELTTSFVKWPSKNGLEWTARIGAHSNNKRKSGNTIILFFYIGLDEDGVGTIEPIFHDARNIVTGFAGSTDGLGKFKVEMTPTNSTEPNVKHLFYTTAKSTGPAEFTEVVVKRLRMFKQDKNQQSVTIGLDPAYLKPDQANFGVLQVTATLPFQMDISYTKYEAPQTPSESDYTTELTKHSKKFSEKFERIFKLKEKNFDEKSVTFAHSALSNLIGGIGYFYGHSLIASNPSGQIDYWNAPLYTAVPSRSFFPRGFLWDEGFHNLLISKWDTEISSDIIAHWLDLLNADGWIPREQILGKEAMAKVPKEFIVQNSNNANPPTLLLSLKSMMEDMKENGDNPKSAWFKDYMGRLWPRLEAWYGWFNTTQTGTLPGSYRWRGRNATSVLELNPKTLTSGLDDFPRASHPTDDERHIDLRCWMALASSLMADIAKFIGKDQQAIKFEETASYLADNELLDALHWSSTHGAYLDFGLHTEDVKLERSKAKPGTHADMVRVTRSSPQLQYVNQLGYVGLFPFLLQIIHPASPKLKQILGDIEDPKKLFTPFGLRSLSKRASLYMKRNTEHDPPYWRGPIWININYLAVRSLHYYSMQEGPYQTQAAQAYFKLRKAVIDNVIREFHRTGYIWEQYNDETGLGQGCKPFTGWSTLVVLMMGENY